MLRRIHVALRVFWTRRLGGRNWYGSLRGLLAPRADVPGRVKGNLAK
jgi:hypothetical protein